MEPVADDDEHEWARLADAALVLERQYHAARSRSAPASPPAPASAAAPPPAPPPAVDADPFALALTGRDLQIERLRSERAGEVANLRNRIRALQGQLLSARNAAGASSAAAAHVAQLEADKGRLNAELRATRRDAVAAAERLAFAEHELAEARDRERQHLAAIDKGAKGRKRDGVKEFGMLEAGALTQAAGTQLGEVVEATQIVRRPATATGVEMSRNVVRAPVKRRRRPSTAGGRLGAAMGKPPVGATSVAEGRVRPEAGMGEQRGGTKRRMDEEEEDDFDATQAEERKPEERKRLGVDVVHDQQHGWGVRLSEATWDFSALRERLFGGDIGDRLLEIATTLKEKPLRDSILRAMASDADWGALLEPVASLQDAGRGPTLVSAQCLAELLTFSEQCRHAVGRGGTTVLRQTSESLARATRDRDARVAAACLHVLVAGACGIGEVGAEAGAETRQELSCEAALDWVRGRGNRGEEDAAVLDARRSAVALVEAVTGLVLEDEEERGDTEESEDGGWRATEWAFVEKAYLCVSNAITNGEADDYTLKHGCAMLVRAGVNAPYVVAERGGSEAAANALMHAVRLQENEFAIGVVVTCAQTLCMTIGGCEGDAGIARHTMNVLLGVIAGVKGDGVVARECRRVARALVSVRNRVKREAR